MKRFLVVLAVLSVMASSLPAAAAPEMVLRLGETHVADYPTTKGDMEFARLVEERTGGRIKIEVYHSKQLGEEKAVIEQVQFGAIDFTRVSISPLAAFAPAFDALQMPYFTVARNTCGRSSTDPSVKNS
jgi:TRAP-type C4-dicarboxylate transport system, periplasmic component